MKLYLGIDNGYTGAIAALLPDGTVLHRPSAVQNLGRDKFLDIRRNSETLREMIDAAAVSKLQVLVACELSTKNPLFRTNNYANGKNGEFWRVLLSMSDIPFVSVHPQTWQAQVFHGLRGGDTKAKALLTVQQRFPNVSYGNYNAEQVRGTDAICIALWAREQNK